MTSRRFRVSDDSTVKDVVSYKVATDGIVEPILSAVVAAASTARQYWPTAGVDPSPITWNTDTITVRQQSTDPADSIATIIFDEVTGSYTYKDFPNADITEVYANPPLDDTLQYLIRVDQTTANGAVITGTLGSWVELFAASLTWSLDRTTEGAEYEEADITIAENDGGGSPVAGTSIVKQVNFESLVLAATTKVAWTSLTKSLYEETEAEVADCDLTFFPAGYADGDADTSGAFSEVWHADYPASPLDPTPVNFTVQVDVISGAVTGSATGVPLTLDVTRTWKRDALVGEDNSNELDVTVSDGVTAITKRVNMRSNYIAPPIEPSVWTTTAWTLSDEAYPQPNGLVAEMTIRFDVTGEATGVMDNWAMSPEEQENEDWHVDAPAAGDPENYEVKFGDANPLGGLNSGPEPNTWHRLDQVREWVIVFPSDSIPRSFFFPASVRTIGGVAVEKMIEMRVGQDNGELP